MGAFPPRCRVAVVDQWVDSGGSMRAAIELVERQQGVVRAAIFKLPGVACSDLRSHDCFDASSCFLSGCLRGCVTLGMQVAAVITLCCEEGTNLKPKLNTQWLRRNYKVCTLVQPNTPHQVQCNNQWLDVWSRKASS